MGNDALIERLDGAFRALHGRGLGEEATAVAAAMEALQQQNPSDPCWPGCRVTRSSVVIEPGRMFLELRLTHEYEYGEAVPKVQAAMEDAAAHFLHPTKPEAEKKKETLVDAFEEEFGKLVIKNADVKAEHLLWLLRKLDEERKAA